MGKNIETLVELENKMREDGYQLVLIVSPEENEITINKGLNPGMSYRIYEKLLTPKNETLDLLKL